MTTLHLLSPPHDGGKPVERLQKVLSGDNVWKKNFRPGKIDRQYGPGTAGAVERAKWYMGYPKNLCDGGVVGDTFFKLMSGKRKLPEEYAKRQRERRAAAAAAAEKGKLRLAALKRARGEIGTKEKPAGSNRVLYSVWYGVIGPWCAMFVTWTYVLSGSKVFKRGSKWAYVPYIKSACHTPGSGVTRTVDPQPGDLVLYDWDNDGEPDHIGEFEKWIDRAAGHFQAVEGNTSAGNNSNGGQVQERADRYLSEVDSFVTVHA